MSERQKVKVFSYNVIDEGTLDVKVNRNELSDWFIVGARVKINDHVNVGVISEIFGYSDDLFLHAIVKSLSRYNPLIERGSTSPITEIINYGYVNQEPKKLRYVYFVSYMMLEDNKWIPNNKEVLYDSQISLAKDLVNVERMLSKLGNHIPCCILNFQLLRTEEI